MGWKPGGPDARRDARSRTRPGPADEEARQDAGPGPTDHHSDLRADRSADHPAGADGEAHDQPDGAADRRSHDRTDRGTDGGPDPGATGNPGPCTLFPSTNVWNRRVDSLPVRADSATLISTIGIDEDLHPAFSSTAWNDGIGYGIPYNLVTSSTPTPSVSFQYASESDPGPYPIPANPRIEGGSDRHILLWNTQSCSLYELFNARKSGGAWLAARGPSGTCAPTRSGPMAGPARTPRACRSSRVLPGGTR